MGPGWLRLDGPDAPHVWPHHADLHVSGTFVVRAAQPHVSARRGLPGADLPQVAALVKTLTAWGLSIDPALKPNLVAAAEACPPRTLAITLKNATRRIQPLSSRNPYAASGDSTVTSIDHVVGSAPGPSITSDLFGLHVPHSTGPAQVPYGYLRLWDSDVGWNAVEPRRGTFHWTVLDRAVRSAEELGAKVSYVFGPTPGWAGDLSTDPPRDLEDFRGFADALVDRYGDRVAAYEVWNEPNLKTSYTGTVSEMVQMTQVLRESVDAAGVDSLVLSPSTTTRTGGSFYNFYLSYIRALGKVGWPIDGYAFHSYPRASGTPADRVHGIALFRAMLDVARAPDLPLFESEINYGLAGLDEPQRPITGTQAQGYLAQTFIEGVRYGITSVQWYLWSSRPYPLLGVQLDPTATHTKLAWDWTVAQLVGSSLRGCLDSAGAAVCGFERDGATFALAYSPTGVPTDVPVPPGLDEVCSMDGVCQPVTTPTVTVGLRPLRLQPTP